MNSISYKVRNTTKLYPVQDILELPQTKFQSFSIAIMRNLSFSTIFQNFVKLPCLYRNMFLEIAMHVYTYVCICNLEAHNLSVFTYNIFSLTTYFAFEFLE